MRGSHALEPLHLPLPSSGRLMRILRSIVAPSTALMAFCDSKLTGCSPIRAQVIRDELVWDKAVSLQKLAHQCECRPLVASARSIEAYERERSGRREIPEYGKTLCLEEHFTSVMALSRSWVLLVNRAGRSQSACLYFNALGHSLPSQIGWKITYSWPM